MTITRILTVLMIGMCFKVHQQPARQPYWVSETGLTQFQQAKNIGLLAHNNQDGKYFDNIVVGSRIRLHTNDDKILVYEVTSIEKWQVLEPSRTYLNLDTNRTMTEAQLGFHYYGKMSGLVLQTCIEKGGYRQWGRMFISARYVGTETRKQVE